MPLSQMMQDWKDSGLNATSINLTVFRVAWRLGQKAGRREADPEGVDDAARYRWLREQHWNESDMVVVCDPKKSVKLGYDCPSGDRLDEAIDAAMKRSGEQKA